MKFTNNLLTSSFTALLSLPFLTSASPITPRALSEPTSTPQIPGILTEAQLTTFSAKGLIFKPDLPEVSLANVSPLVLPTEKTSRRRGPLCETSDASAEVWEIQQAIDYLRGLPANTLCVQTNGWGSYCTQMVSRGGAQISLCGSHYATITCALAASLAEDVKNFCERGGRAGGINYWDSYTRVLVH